MDRIKQYFEKYTLLTTEAKEYLQQKGKLLYYKKNAYFILQDETKHSWCFLLEGLAGYQVPDDRGNMTLERLCPVNHYFVGTKHLFSKNSQKTALQFLQSSVVYTISNKDLKKGIQQFKELSDIYHILKQHEVDLTKIFLRLPNLVREVRLAHLFDYLPETRGQLTVKQLCSLLGYSDDRQYYRALYYYNNRRS